MDSASRKGVAFTSGYLENVEHVHHKVFAHLDSTVYSTATIYR